MAPILDQQGNILAYLHLNILLNDKQDAVIGLILGNCVFGEGDAPVGKFFKDGFRTTAGELVGIIDGTTSSVRPKHESAILLAAWKRLIRVKEHTCMWVAEKNTWSDLSFDAFLRAGKPVYV